MEPEGVVHYGFHWLWGRSEHHVMHYKHLYTQGFELHLNSIPRFDTRQGILSACLCCLLVTMGCTIDDRMQVILNQCKIVSGESGQEVLQPIHKGMLVLFNTLPSNIELNGGIELVVGIFILIMEVCSCAKTVALSSLFATRAFYSLLTTLTVCTRLPTLAVHPWSWALEVHSMPLVVHSMALVMHSMVRVVHSRITELVVVLESRIMPHRILVNVHCTHLSRIGHIRILNFTYVQSNLTAYIYVEESKRTGVRIISVDLFGVLS